MHLLAVVATALLFFGGSVLVFVDKVTFASGSGKHPRRAVATRLRLAEPPVSVAQVSVRAICMESPECRADCGHHAIGTTANGTAHDNYKGHRPCRA